MRTMIERHTTPAIRTARQYLLVLAATALVVTTAVRSQTTWSTPDDLQRVVREMAAQPTDQRVAYVRASLHSLRVPFREQPFDTVLVGNEGSLHLRGTNLIVRMGTGTPVTVIGGHLDAVPNSPGANDNAAAVAVMLGLISEWHATGAPGAVEVVFFDREENGLIGSDVYAKTVDPATHRAMINLDVVGSGDEIFAGPVGGGDDRRIVPALRKAADSLRLRVIFGEHYPDSDHESFARRGLENISISALPRGDVVKLQRLLKDGWTGKDEDMPKALATMHTPADTPEHIDPHVLTLVLRFVRTTVAILHR